MKEIKHTLKDIVSIDYYRDYQRLQDRVTTKIPVIKDGRLEHVMAEFTVQDYSQMNRSDLIKHVVGQVNQSLKVVQEYYLKNIIEEGNYVSTEK